MVKAMPGKESRPPRRRHCRGPLGTVVRAVTLLLLLWAAGFILFVLKLPGAAAPQTRTEAVVVLTGGPGRLDRGVAVLQAHLAERLLISGVDPKVRPAELQQVARIPPPLFDCCVDLGFNADTTRANAREAADWVRAHGFLSVRLVTAAYHLPRARAELEAQLPADVLIVPDGVSAGLPLFAMLMEYAKFQAAWLLLRVRPV